MSTLQTTFLKHPDAAGNQITFTSGGNTGIGTASPERNLHVFKGESGGAASNADSSLVLENSSNTYLQFLTPSSFESGILFGDDDNNVGAITYSHSNNSLSFTANASFAMTVDSSGRLLVGTSSSSCDGIVTVMGRVSAPGGTGGEISLAHPTTLAPGGGTLGAIHFGNNADNRGASIRSVAESTWTSGDYPSRLEFSTTANSASSPTERMRINSNGQCISVGSFDSSDIASGKTLDELPYIGDYSKRIYRYSSGKTAAIGAYEAVFKISFSGGSSDTAHFKIRGNTFNSISSIGNIGHSYVDFTFSTGNGSTPRLNTHETVVDGSNYNSGFCQPLLDGNDVWIFVKSNSSSSSARLDVNNIILEVETIDSSSFTLYSVSGTPTANGVSNPSVVTNYSLNNSLAVSGSLSKGSGSFKIDHPLTDKTSSHYLVHSFIEGPQADLIYRGHIQLVDGQATVNIDEASRMSTGTFEALCTNVCCYTSNESDWTPVRGYVSGSILTIEAQDPTSTADVCWIVVGERKDLHMIETDWTDENGRVITEPLKNQLIIESPNS